ncbi:hypothetical protein EUU23_10130 [Sphingorhabdus sp. IMCC26285]|uniref:ChrR-like cupin domain-containing protein n=1 Tax=Sphingorhabdus profundilacus TaxID=2509718 RepID=A0A6I4M128_9SPHN|nr:cupin domain-containing protein [Sphingorhabdus profundilacus]MVZ98063.1 hypothetical protein [Sphingorhabdus profundilacus]
MNINEMATQYVMGILSPRERHAVSLERLYNLELDREIIRLEQLLGEGLVATKPACNAGTLWDRIDTALTRELTALGDKCVEDFSEGAWEAHGTGIDVKPLWSDKAILIRCVPGGYEEEHGQPHDEDEHIIVIAGDLNIGGRTFSTGDYICVPAASIHQRMHSDGGCILFTLYKNTSDEPVPVEYKVFDALL